MITVVLTLSAVLWAGLLWVVFGPYIEDLQKHRRRRPKRSRWRIREGALSAERTPVHPPASTHLSPLRVIGGHRGPGPHIEYPAGKERL